MKLIEYKRGRYFSQADPFIFRAQNGKYYLYVTGDKGVRAYRADSLTGEYEDIGIVFTMPGKIDYWAPSIIFTKGKYYMYVSCQGEQVQGCQQAMHVGSSNSPEGPFGDFKQLIAPFSIDSHVVENESGLYMFYSVNDCEYERPGTYIVVDKMLDPETMAGKPVPVVRPTIDEEISGNCSGELQKTWHTIEGAFYFREGEWQYVIYSGSAYQRECYFLGYAAAKTDELDLTKIKFEKYPDAHTYRPLMAKNEWEEGTGHNSLIKEDGQWYVVYHGRDLVEDTRWEGEKRTARICKLSVEDGVLTAKRREKSL